MHCGYIIKVEKLRPHTNADRLQVLEVFGTATCVPLDVRIGDIGVYFPADLQLSEEFCDYNHLCRTAADGTPDNGYLERGKRNVKAIKLRGERSDGTYLPLFCFEYTGADLESFKPGDQITVVNGHEICRKYIPRTNQRQRSSQPGDRKRKTPIAPLFKEHADTEQLAYNLDKFNEGDYIEVTLKMHGTSQRTGYLPVLKGYKRTLLDRILRKEGKLIYEYDYVTGTRRTVLENYDGGFYGNDAFRKIHADKFTGKLQRGETVYYEVCGWVDKTIPIMPNADNKKLNDKEFIKKYGEVTQFSYDCEPGESEIYVYRMTMTNEDGYVVEYSPEQMRLRCEQMGIKTVPLLWRGEVPAAAGEFIFALAEDYAEGADPIGKTHIREGVVVRQVNKPWFAAYKHKNYEFKVLENIIKENAIEPDLEEAETLREEEENA